MLDYKITKAFIRSPKFVKELKYLLPEEGTMYKIIMHHRFKLIACTEQEYKLCKKLDNLVDKIKKEPGDEGLMREFKRTSKELNHHRTISERLKFTIRNELLMGGVI